MSSILLYHFLYIYVLYRDFTWSTTPSSYPHPTLQASSSWVCWDTTSSVLRTIRKTFSVAQRATAKSGVKSPLSSSVPTDRPTAAFTKANWWHRPSGGWPATWTTRATWWARWRTAWPVAACTCCRIFTSSTWPSCWCIAAYATSTAAVTNTARTGTATPPPCHTVCCLASFRLNVFSRIPECESFFKPPWPHTPKPLVLWLLGLVHF